ncbi:MAG: NAD-dependent epimerase/dehydratase family protein, partial [Leptospiraceae bacterium]|nr:NAD-dependent epimerase/dehydratase family protein [Leptospiraceae bacterium]
MSSRKDHFLITGSTGFVGTHVCDILNETGQRYSTISHSNLLKPDHKVRELIEKSDAIIYLAGLAHRM